MLPMDESIRKQLVAGAVVSVTQQIPHRDRVWTNRVKGVVVSYQQKQTGSWFAHSKDDKLWLDRLVLRKEDGEITSLNLADYTHLEIIPPEPAKAPGVATAYIDGDVFGMVLADVNREAIGFRPPASTGGLQIVKSVSLTT